MFEGQTGIVNGALVDLGLLREPIVWFIQPGTAWVPVILADVWKTTPFVALLLLAGLQNIDTSLYEAARIDGASAWRQFRHVTLPLLKPAILVALIFRTLDAFRVFDLIYALTGGGPGTSTEPIALYTFTSLLQTLLVLASALPFYWAVVSSFTPEARLFEAPTLIPRQLVLDHYRVLFAERNF